MSITIKLAYCFGTRSIEDVVRFYQANRPDVFYQECLQPFVLMLMSVRAGRVMDTKLSIYTPDVQLALPLTPNRGARGHRPVPVQRF